MNGCYEPLSQRDRDRIAEDCLRGQNSNRASIAKEIRDGDLFNDAGRLKTYWHCLATKAPPAPAGRGQYKAEQYSDMRYDGWVWHWQSWER